MAKYTLEVEVDEFQDKALKRKAKMKDMSAEDILMNIVAGNVQDELNEMVVDALNTKLSKMPAGKALAIIEAMDE